MKKTIMRTYRKKTQAQGNSFASNIYQRVFENEDFVGEQALVIELKERNDAFEAADAKAVLGGTDRTAARNKRYDAVMDQLDTTADAIEYRSNGDTSIAEAAGFEAITATPPRTVDYLSVPMGLKGKDVPTRKGVAKIGWKKDPDAVNYGIFFQVDGETEWQNGTFSTRVNTLVLGLPSGKYVSFKIYSIGRNGLKSDLTEPVTVLVS
jgi:hypothetical protein